MHSLTQEALAQRLGIGQSTVANKLRLLKLPQDVQDALLKKQITERHARSLIPLKSPEKQVQTACGNHRKIVKCQADRRAGSQAVD